jgi:hypothetical protein
MVKTMRTRLVLLGLTLLGLACTVHERSLEYDDTGGTTGAGGGGGGTAGGGGGNATCNSSSTSPCSACINAHCCSEFNACYGSKACQDLLSCEADCTGTACNACTTQYPTGVTPLNALLNCSTLSCQSQCSSSSDAGTDAGTSLPAAIAQNAAAQCGKMRDCAPGSVAWVYGTYDACVARATLLYTYVSGLPDTNLSASTQTACANAWNAVTCSAYFGADPNVCWVPGTRTNGQGCNAGDQCSSMFCKQNAWSCGTCAPMPAAGVPCKQSSECGRGTWCNSGACQKSGGVGAICTAALPCENDLNCVGGLCTAAPAVNGATCDPAAGLSCDSTQNFFCGGAGKCVGLTFVAAGQPCGVTSASATLCEKQGSCTSATCLAAPSDHGTCDPTNDTCQWPAVCSSAKTCMLPGDAPACAK